MDIETLGNTLTAIENELLKRKMDKIASGERDFDEYEDSDDVEDEETADVEPEDYDTE